MANILVELLRRIVVQLDVQSQAIQHLTQAHVNLTKSQQRVIDRSENILQMYDDFSTIQKQILEGQRLLMERIENLTAIIDQLQQQQSIGYQIPGLEHSETTDPVYGLLDVYFDDLKALKHRIQYLEALNGVKPEDSK